MRMPLDMVTGIARGLLATGRDLEAPVRVSVYLDSTASGRVVRIVRDAFVPRTPTAMVRVDRLSEGTAAPRPDTDVALVVSNGSSALERYTGVLMASGVPTVILPDRAEQVAFAPCDAPMLGVVADERDALLLERLARWVLDRTEKATAFAAGFPFMRVAATNRIVREASLGNAVTGALVFMPGADFPVMAVQQVGMALALAGVYGRRMAPERGYEVAGVLAGGLLLRAASRALSRRAGHAGFAVKAAVAGAGTYAMGRALVGLYERDVDYSRANRIVLGAAERVRLAVRGRRGDGSAPAGADGDVCGEKL